MAVYAKQYGRLGNNLFQKAAAIGYAINSQVDYKFDGKPRNPVYLTENAHSYNALPTYAPLLHRDRDVVLNGYWQSEKYFVHCREEVVKAFGYKWEPRPGWCSIHVRRADYLNYPDKHPVVTDYYLVQAMGHVINTTDIDKFMVFSDDILWCKGFFSIFRCRFEYSEYRTQEEDLELMSGCEHNIISNSTFSWWGAWLNKNPDKIVISPSKDNWFGPGNAHLDTSDLIPESWIQIKY